MNNEDQQPGANEAGRKEETGNNKEWQETGTRIDQQPMNGGQIKERQPSRAGDLSPVHDTHEVGTSGGDQRTKDNKADTREEEGESIITNLGKETVPPAPIKEPRDSI